jgi:photosystem II stability/assembly factor-like uncharacterized protein
MNNFIPKILVSLFLLILSADNGVSQRHWTNLDPINNYLIMYPLSRDTIYTVTWNSDGNHSSYQLNRSVDGGFLWDHQMIADFQFTPSLRTYLQPYSLYFFNPQDGIMTGIIQQIKGTSVFDYPLMWQTHDSGKTWTDLASNDSTLQGPAFITASKNGIATVTFHFDSLERTPMYFRTLDRGRSWTLHSLPKVSRAYPYPRVQPTFVVFPDSVNGYLCSYRAFYYSDMLAARSGEIFYATKNGGTTWEVADSVALGDTYYSEWPTIWVHDSVLFRIDQHARDQYHGKTYFRSDNLGRSWETVHGLDTNLYSSVYLSFYCLRNDVGFIESPAGFFYFTSDDGRNWSFDTLGLNLQQGIYEIETIDSSVIFAITNIQLSNGLWKTTPSSATVAWAATRSQSLYFPNPASDFLYLPPTEPAVVYDALGRKVECKIERTTAYIKLEVRTLPDGAYYLLNGHRFIVKH